MPAAYDVESDDPFVNWGTHDNFINGLCCSPCIYAFAVAELCNIPDTYNPKKTCPFLTWQSCGISLGLASLGIVTAWMPIAGSVTRYRESEKSSVCSIFVNEWLCNPCCCAPCAMAEHIKRVNAKRNPNDVVEETTVARLL